MSDNLISVEPGFPVKINLKIIDNNKKIDVELENSIESTLLLHNLDFESHPVLVSGLAQVSNQVDQQTANLLNIAENLTNKDTDLENKINQNKNGDSAVSFSVASPILSSHAASKEYVDIKAGRNSNIVTGLGLSTLSSIITVAAGYCLNSTLTKLINLTSSFSKTLALFAVGSGNGGLDVSGSFVSKTFYVYAISKENGQSDVLFSLNSSNPILPSDFTAFRNIGYFSTNTSGVPSSIFPSQDIQSAYANSLIANSDLSNISALAKNTITGLSMPSNRYIDITVGATGFTYTAPANGYFYLSKSATAGGQYISLANTKYYNTVVAYGAGYMATDIIPVIKNDVVTITYSTAGVTGLCRFIYAEGAI